jgi:hypothetical protein
LYNGKKRNKEDERKRRKREGIGRENEWEEDKTVMQH